MDQLDLFHSRQLWLALFRSGVVINRSTWKDWADSKISLLEAVPAWVINLSMADAKIEAMDAVRADIGREYLSIDAGALSDEALLIGFVYERYAAGEVTASGMWATINREVDFAEFMDAEKWKHFSQTVGPVTEVAGGADGKEEVGVAKELAPIGLFARQQAIKHIGIAASYMGLDSG
jgi:hypothetical protein